MHVNVFNNVFRTLGFLAMLLITETVYAAPTPTSTMTWTPTHTPVPGCGMGVTHFWSGDGGDAGGTAILVPVSTESIRWNEPCGNSLWISTSTSADASYGVSNFSDSRVFVIPAGVDLLRTTLTVRFKADDGAVVYCNGVVADGGSCTPPDNCWKTCHSTTIPGSLLNSGANTIVFQVQDYYGVVMGLSFEMTADYCVPATETPTSTPTGTPTATLSSTPTSTPMAPIRLWPNPYNPLKAVRGTLKCADMPDGASLAIYTLSGEKVFEEREAGHRVEWNGKTGKGDRATVGVYYYYVRQAKGALLKGILIIQIDP